MGTTRGFNRRQLIGGAAAATAFAVGNQTGFAAGGGRGYAPALLRSQGANIPTPREQTVVIEASQTTVYDSFNPYIPNGWAYNWGNEVIALEYPFYLNLETGETVKGIGEKWTYNADFTEVTLTLRPGITWSDGQPLTSADVVFTVEMLGKHEGLSSHENVNRDVAKIEAVDELNAKYTLKKPNPRYHYAFVAGVIGTDLKVVPKHIWEKQDPLTFKNAPPVWSGAYMLDHANATQKMYVWKKNPNYWDKANFDPKPTYVLFLEALPVDAAVQEFLRGGMDSTAIDYLNQQVVLQQDQGAIQYFFADPNPRGLTINMAAPSGLFKHKEAAWALSYLLDREKIGKTIWQPETPPAMYPWASYASNKRWEVPEIQQKYNLTYDPDKAAQLLDSIGARREGDTRTFEGKEININMITPAKNTQAEYQIGDTLIREAKKIGLNITMRYLQTWIDAWETGQCDVSCHWLHSPVRDPNEMYGDFLTEKIRPVGTRALDGNETRTNVQELNDISLKLATLSPTDDANLPEFAKGLEQFMQWLPYVPIIQTTYPFMFGTKYWTGWPTNDNRYTVAANWWSQFRFVIGKLQPAGS